MNDNSHKPAMPLETPVKFHFGLIKREYMAAMVLQGILSNDRTITTKNLSSGVIRHVDELLEALEK